MEIKLKVNIGELSKWFDNQNPERSYGDQRDGREVTYSCIASAVFVLIMKLLTWYNYSYVLSTINFSILDTVVSIFLFIYRTCTFSIYLSQFAWDSVSESLDSLLEQLSAVNRKIGER